MKYGFCVFTLILCACNKPFFHSWERAVDKCMSMCDSDENYHSKAIWYSPGGCICDNREGRIMVEGYQKNLNGQCNRPDEDRN